VFGTAAAENMPSELRVAGCNENEVEFVIVTAHQGLQVLLGKEIGLAGAFLTLEQETVTVIAVLLKESLAKGLSSILDAVPRPVESFWRWFTLHHLFE